MSDSTVSTSRSFKVSMKEAPSFVRAHTDGSWFEYDPLGRIHILFYNEYGDLQRDYTMRIIGNQIDYPDLDTAKQFEIKREIQAEMVMSLDVALQLYATLGDNLRQRGVLK